MIEYIVKIAREKLLLDLSPSASMQFLASTLEGCPEDLMLKVITGEQALNVTEDGYVELVDGEKNFDIKKDLLDEIIYQLEWEYKDVNEILSELREAIDVNQSIDLSVGYASIVKAYVEKDFSHLFKDCEDNSYIWNIISLFCEKATKFINRTHDAFLLFSWVANKYGIKANPDSLIEKSNEIQDVIYNLCEGTDPYITERAFQKEQVNKYINGVSNVQSMLESDDLEPIDVRSDAVTGWIAPDGSYYGLYAATANFIHLHLAEKICELGIVEEDGDLPERALERDGWVKVHAGKVLFYSHIGGGEPNDITEAQRNTLIEYANAHYGGVLKFGTFDKDIHMNKFRQMDRFALRKLFD